jgi:hypothetical protein
VSKSESVRREGRKPVDFLRYLLWIANCEIFCKTRQGKEKVEKMNQELSVE